MSPSIDRRSQSQALRTLSSQPAQHPNARPSHTGFAGQSTFQSSPDLKPLSSPSLAQTNGLTVPTQQLQAVQAADTAYQNAKAACTSANQELAKELTALGPGISDTERTAFIQQFRKDPKYADVYQQEGVAATNLQNVLAANKDAISAYAGGAPYLNNPSPADLHDTASAVNVLMKGYADLATSSQPEAAVTFASAELSNPRSPFQFALQMANKADLNGFDLQKDILAPATAGWFPAYMAAHPSATAEDAVTALKAAVGVAASVQIVGANGTTIGDALSSLDRIAKGDAGAMVEMASFATSKLGGAFGAAGLAVAAVSGFASVQGKDPIGVLTAAVLATREGANMLNGMLTAYNEATAHVTLGSKALGHLALGANAVLNVLDMVNTLSKEGELNGGDKLNLAANAVGIGASLAAIEFAGTVPIAVPVAAAASLLALGGSLVSGYIDNQQLHDALVAHLTAANISDPEGRIRLGINPTQAQLLQSTPPNGWGMSPGDAASFADKNPGLFQGLTPQAIGFAGGQSAAFLNALAAHKPPFDTATVVLLMADLSPGVSKAQLENARTASMYGGNPLNDALLIAEQFAAS